MKQNITVKLAGKEYPLCIDSEREEIIRSAAAKLNLEIDALKFDYGDRSMAEILSVLLLSVQSRLMELEAEKAGKVRGTMSELEDLTTDLDKYLSR